MWSGIYLIRVSRHREARSRLTTKEVSTTRWDPNRSLNSACAAAANHRQHDEHVAINGTLRSTVGTSMFDFEGLAVASGFCPCSPSGNIHHQVLVGMIAQCSVSTQQKVLVHNRHNGLASTETDCQGSCSCRYSRRDCNSVLVTGSNPGRRYPQMY